MYKIMIRSQEDANMWRVYTQRMPDVEVIYEEIEDPETGEVTTVKKETELETSSVRPFETENHDVFEAKCIELLKKYNLSQLKFIEDLEYGVDLLFKGEPENSKE